jgi:hypothetical protein
VEQGAEGGKKDFHAPAGQSADNKMFPVHDELLSRLGNPQFGFPFFGSIPADTCILYLKKKESIAIV